MSSAPQSNAHTHRITPVLTHISFCWILPLMNLHTWFCFNHFFANFVLFVTFGKLFWRKEKICFCDNTKTQIFCSTLHMTLYDKAEKVLKNKQMKRCIHIILQLYWFLTAITGTGSMQNSRRWYNKIVQQSPALQQSININRTIQLLAHLSPLVFAVKQLIF